jgi:D-3-phosphoglycerate dehydrogenase
MKLLIIDPFPEPWLSEIHSLIPDTDYQPDIRPEAVAGQVSGCDILVLNSKVRVDRNLLGDDPQLKLIVRAGSGMDHFDLPWLAKKGIEVKNMAGANADSVGEHTVGMLLALRHRLHTADKEVRRFIWRREANRGSEIGGKTVGIIGYGHTGSAVARKLRGFGCRILAYDKYKTGFGSEWVEEVQPQTIFAEADILSLHIPLTDETRGMVNAAYLRQFGRPVLLLNLSRGPIVDLQDLLHALDAGKLTGTALDVLPNEKMELLDPEERALYEDLFRRENVILSPHTGGWSRESLANICSGVVGAVRDFVEASGK